METSVVIFDPRPSPLRLGTLASDQQVPKLEAAGVVLLPVEASPSTPLHFAQSYAFRSFGENEILLKSDSPKRAIGMALEHNGSTPHLHWLLGVSAVGPEARGVFTILCDSGPTGLLQSGSIAATPSILEPGELPLPGDSIVIGGHATITAPNDIIGLSIHARAHDVSILWCAVSQCAVPRHMGALLR